MSESLQTSAIPLEQIQRNAKQHRKHFDEKKLEELAQSVRKLGVLQPVIVRPLKSAKGKAKYELVAGERRWRACGLAKLKTIPALVRELDDKEALEVALVENLRREDVLPLEEAEGYRELHEVHKVSVEQLAEQVGKSKEYVYGRLKLCELNSPTARRLLDEGRVEPSTALLIARIPGEKLQERAAMAILKGGAWDDDREEHGPMSFRAAKDVVQREYMLQLSKAPFNTKDAQLEPEAGACGPCPKRTGNCKALYPDVKSENVCTDPECFGKKKAVAFKAEAAAAKEKGQRLLKESKALWDYEGKRLGYRGQEKYVELTDKLPGDKKGRTFKELLGEKAPVVLARDPNGKVHQLLEKERLEEALAAAGHKVKVKDKSSGRGNDDYAKQQEEERFRHRVVQRLLSAVFSKINAGKVDELTALRSLAGWLYQTEDPELQSAWQERAGADHQVRKYIDEAPRALLVALLFESLLYEELSRTWNGYHHRTKEVCALAGVELDAVEKEQQAADKAAAANPPANGREGIKAEGEDLEEDGEDA